MVYKEFRFVLVVGFSKIIQIRLAIFWDHWNATADSDLDAKTKGLLQDNYEMDWWKKKKSRAVAKKQRLILGRVRGEILSEELIECCDGKSIPIKLFSAADIIKATGNFCNCSRVSQLFGFERWYSGTLDNHRTILVKKLWRAQSVFPKDFYPEARDITISSMVSGHKNFMKLAGCCLEIETPFMVYYGSEKQYSTVDLKMVVSWEKRIKIAEDVATALAYLHTAFPRPFVYSNMDLRNIVLDDDGVGKLSDFSYCVSIPKGQTCVKLDYIRGAYDYIDDDYKISHVVSEKTDVFGFGILMQKLLTGEERFREICGRKDRKTLLKRKFSRLLSKPMGEGRVGEIVDPRMLEKMGEVDEEERFQMEAFLVLSERCIGLRGEVPKMVEVAKQLKRFRQNFFFR